MTSLSWEMAKKLRLNTIGGPATHKANTRSDGCMTDAPTHTSETQSSSFSSLRFKIALCMAVHASTFSGSAARESHRHAGNVGQVSQIGHVGQIRQIWQRHLHVHIYTGSDISPGMTLECESQTEAPLGLRYGQLKKGNSVRVLGEAR